MAPKKKKAKSTTNPARGIATTSIPTRTKREDHNDDSKILSDQHGKVSDKTMNEATATEPNEPSEPKNETTGLFQLSPDQLEQQLENSELQFLLDQYGPKTRQASSRAASKLMTDKRIFRGQATLLSTKEWLPDDLVDYALSIIQGEKNDVSISNSRIKRPFVAEEDLLIRLWCLRETLLQIGFDVGIVGSTLQFLAEEPHLVNLDIHPWGISEALEHLAVHCDLKALPPYTRGSVKSSNSSEPSSRPITPSLPVETKHAFFEPSRESLLPSNSRAEDILSEPVTTANARDLHASADNESDSDVEPEQLISTYIRIKTRLLHERPDLVTSQTSNKNARSERLTSRLNEPLAPGIKKLQSKMQKIESDILFDQQQANEIWKTEYPKLIREDVASRKGNQSEATADKASVESQSQDNFTRPSNPALVEEAMVSTNSTPKMMDQDDESDLFGEMFTAIPSNTESGADNNNKEEQASKTVTIRNFGQSSGLSPRRVLEDACRARDAYVKLSFKHVSQTTYSSRHALLIAWSKEQESPDTCMIPDVHCTAESRQTIFTMVSIAAPELAQSESYIATAALFVLFSGSPKEEKAHLRLPPVWRDVWTEFAATKQERIDAKDREVLRGLRDTIRRQPEKVEDGEDDVVLTSGFRRRAQNLESGGSSPVPEQEFIVPSAELKETWRRKSSSPAYQRMLQLRATLPMAKFQNDVLTSIEKNQITIICGETGCGKSTQVPAYLLEHQLSRGRDCKIYCTQPRRISAISLAQRVSEELGEHKMSCGTSKSLVGYAIRLESQVTAQTKLVFATVGILLRMLESPQGLEGITHLIIDEVHERSIDTDFLLILLRSLTAKRPSLKVVLMSATVDADRFSRYLDNAPTLNIPGRTFPVHTKFLEDALEMTGYKPNDVVQESVDQDSEDMEADATERDSTTVQKLRGYSSTTINTLRKFDEYRMDYDLVIALLEKIAFDPVYSQYSRAILVFLPGINEIRRLHDLLTGHSSFMSGWLIYSLHSTISSEDQQQAFLIPPQGMRKIVLSTNITETSVTIPDIVCVIDTAKHKEMRYDERRQLSRLIQAFISRANAKQRRGRAGRVQEGICFHLITKHRHDNMIAPQQTPEMLRLSLQELCMRVKICKMGGIEYTLSQALDPPSAKNIRRAIDALIEVNALTSAEELTDLGKQLAKLPLDAHLGKLVLMASVFGCLDFALTVAAFLSSKSPFIAPMGQKQRADAVRLGFKKGDSDLLTAYNAYCAWRRLCQSGTSDWQFCKKNFLSPQNLVNIEDLKAQLLGSLVDASFVVLDPSERAMLNRIRSSSRARHFVPELTRENINNGIEVVANSVTAWSLYPKLLVRDGKGWRNVANNQSVSLHPSSVNKVSDSKIKYLSFYHIMQTSTRFMNAHETSPCPEISLVLLAGEADFKLYAGVIVIDGNRLRFMVDSWKVMMVLKKVRENMKEIVDRRMRKPGIALPERLEKWAGIWRRVMGAQTKT